MNRFTDCVLTVALCALVHLIYMGCQHHGGGGGGGNILPVAEADSPVLLARVAALEEKLASVSVVGKTVLFTGVNVQVVNGAGGTSVLRFRDFAGTGNLIVGYNEPRENGDVQRTGSHNLIVVPQHNYSTVGGIVA